MDSPASINKHLGSDKDTEKPIIGKRWHQRKWLKRLGVGFLALGLLLACFHRTIFFEGTRYFIIRAAKQQHLDLSYDISGSIFTTLSVINLRARPTEPGPIRRLEIGVIHLRYSLWDLVCHGLPVFLKELDVRNVFVELTPAESLPLEKEQKPQTFKFPDLVPESLNFENINLIVRGQSEDTILEGFGFSLFPDRPGVLKINTLDVPGMHRWSDLSASTSYRDRFLKLTNFSIGSEISLNFFELDLSQIQKNKLAIASEGTFFETPIHFSARVSDLNKSNHVALRMEAGKLIFDHVSNYFGLQLPFDGELEQFIVSFDGTPDLPSKWMGKAHTKVTQLSYNQKRLGNVAVDFDISNAQARLNLHGDIGEKNSLTFTTAVALPEKIKDFSAMAAQGRLEILAQDAAQIPFLENLSGDFIFKADLRTNEGKLHAHATIDSGLLAIAEVELAKSHLALDLDKNFQSSSTPILQNLVARLEGVASAIRFHDYSANAPRLKMAVKENAVHLEEFSLEKEGNAARVSASYTLPENTQPWLNQPLMFDFAVDAPKLDAFTTGADLKGALQITGTGVARDKIFDGKLEAQGYDITVNGVPIHSLAANLSVARNHLTASHIKVILNDKNQIMGNGEAQCDGNFAYRGMLDAKFKDLSLFQPLIGKSGPIGGALSFFWNGEGEIQNPHHTGQAVLDFVNGRFGEQKNLSAHFTANYGPDFIDVPDFSAAVENLHAIFSLFWKDNRLRISNLSLQQKQLTLLTGAMEVPFHLAQWQDPLRLFPSNEPLTLSLQAKNMDLRNAFLQLGKKNPPLLGNISLEVNASGSLENLQGKAAWHATGLQSTTSQQIAPANVSLDLNLQDARLFLDGSLRQPLVQPLRITGNMAFDAAQVRAKGFDPNTPVDLSINLPRSSLAFISSLVPAVRQIRGTAEMDVHLTGTVGTPRLGGKILADIGTLRFANASLPPLDTIAFRVNLAGDRLSIEQCQGGIAGGTFLAVGSVNFANLDNPIFDLHMGSRNALVLQNDELTARISSNLYVNGPLKSGNVQGTVWITRTRFFKNIEILPIGLPGRPAPQPPPEPSVVGITTPPLRDWKFDVVVKTLDPVLVQGNLANGRIFADLHLGGTGLEPWMDGEVTIEKLTTSLPFSRLEVKSGQIFFTRTSPFIPQLNIQATSVIREYDVIVYITGPAPEPNALFTSNPPLPQEEVVSLLATGMTTTELSRDPNALAGRAAIYAAQRLYQRIFRKNKPPPESESFFNRLQFDIGGIDSKSGRQSAKLGIPLSGNIMLTGGLDVGGNFNGQVKYLIRFK